MSVIDSVKQRVSVLRERRPVVDHLVRAVEHYGQVNGSALAAAVTYFAFLSFFPILALAFAIFGQVTKVYEDAQDTLVDAANSVLPASSAARAGSRSTPCRPPLRGSSASASCSTLYSGLGWLSGMRSALMAIFEEPEREQPSFLFGKLRDVLALMALGTILVASVAVSGVATKVLTPITEWLDLGVVAEGFFWVLALCLGLAANTLLYFAFFRLLAQPDIPSRSLLSGALLGAVLFELLKQLSTFLLKATANSDAFQAFGIALILLVWINYFSRVVVLSAAWAHTSPEARAIRDASRVADQMPEGPRIDLAAAAPGVRPASPSPASSPQAAFAAGAAAMLGLVALLRRRG